MGFFVKTTSGSSGSNVASLVDLQRFKRFATEMQHLQSVYRTLRMSQAFQMMQNCLEGSCLSWPMLEAWALQAKAHLVESLPTHAVTASPRSTPTFAVLLLENYTRKHCSVLA